MSYYATHKNADLKRMLRQRDLRVGGNKAELVSRLIAYDLDHPFPFLKLPGEIRNEIYKYVAASDNIPKDKKIKSAPRKPRGTAYYIPTGKIKPQASIAQPALFRTCTQIYQESRALFYRHHKFKLPIWHEEKSFVNHVATFLHLPRHLTCLERVIKWLDSVTPDMRKQIRTLEIEIHYSDSSTAKAYIGFLDDLHSRLSDDATVIYRPSPTSRPYQTHSFGVLWGLGKILHDRDASRLPRFEHPNWILPDRYTTGHAADVWAHGFIPLYFNRSRGHCRRPSLTFGPGLGWFGKKA